MLNACVGRVLVAQYDGATADEVADGQEAVEALAKINYDLVLMGMRFMISGIVSSSKK